MLVIHCRSVTTGGNCKTSVEIKWGNLMTECNSKTLRAALKRGWWYKHGLFTVKTDVSNEMNNCKRILQHVQ